MVLPVDQEVGTASKIDHTHSRQAGGQSTEEKVKNVWYKSIVLCQ